MLKDVFNSKENEARWKFSSTGRNSKYMGKYKHLCLLTSYNLLLKRGRFRGRSTTGRILKGLISQAQGPVNGMETREETIRAHKYKAKEVRKGAHCYK